jgi:hypothetical protein
MLQNKLKLVYLFSGFIALLAALASAAGLATSLYRDNVLTTAAWRGNDVVTLFIAVPVLVIAALLARRGSLRALLVWLGALWYMLYNYLFYLYGASLNRAFLLYTTLVTLSLFALILGLASLDIEEIGRKFHARTPVRPISIFMLFIPLIMGVMVEIPQVMQMVFDGQVHPDILKFDHPTAVVHATDITLLFPAVIVGAVLLWKRRPWGYILTALLMFKGATYTLALVFMSYFAAQATGSGDPLLPVYGVFCAGGVLSLGFLLGNLQGAAEQADAIPSPSQVN